VNYPCYINAHITQEQRGEIDAVVNAPAALAAGLTLSDVMREALDIALPEIAERWGAWLARNAA
jgi:hypothetical protein